MNRTMLVPMVVAAALFMENMDSTVIATSLPAIASDLGQNPVTLKLAFTAYLLSLAVFIPVSGWAADRFGARTVFQCAMAIFTVGSMGCGMAHSLGWLVACRVLQGMGGAMMAPVARLIVLKVVPRHELLSAIAYLTVPALIGPMIGPPLGGFITTYAHWRWIFWINVPVCVLGVALAAIFLPDVREDHPKRLDVNGFVLSALGLGTLMFGATLLGQAIAPRAVVAALLLVGLASTGLYFVHARRVESPILDLRLLSISTFRSSVLGGFLFRIGIGAIPFLLPLMLQLGFGLNPFETGTLTFSAAAGALLMKVAAQPILRWLGFRRVLVGNALISAVLLATCALFTPTTPHLLILAALLVGGFLRSLQFTALNAIVFADVDPAEMSAATVLSTVAQQLSLSFGVAVAAWVLELAEAARGTSVLAVEDYALAFIVISAIAATSAIVHARLPNGAGAALVTPRSPAPTLPASTA